LHPGYRELGYGRSRLIYPATVELPEAYHCLDEYIGLAERFHRLAMPERVTVIVCRSWNDFGRFMPQIRSRGVAAVTLVTGTVIYVTPKVVEKRLDPAEYLRHELSHAALHQNQSPLNGLRIARQQWLAEGLAVLFGEQKSYLSPEEFLARAREQELGPIIDPESRGAVPVPFDMRMGYQTWRYFLEHLIETRGEEVFHRYLKSYIAQPGDYRELFVRTFGVSLGRAIRLFEEDVRKGRWKPVPGFITHHLGTAG
jgi:hypothetical protein